MNDPAIDTGHLEKIGATSDPVVAGIVDRFMLTLDQRLTALADAAAREEFSSLAQLAHQLRGSASNCGCSTLSQLCTAVESCPESFDRQVFESVAALTIAAWHSLGLRQRVVPATPRA